MNPPKKISVLLAEDHVIVRQGLRSLLDVDGRFTMAGEARTGREAVAMARSLRPDVILMDIAMPMLNGLEATRQILAANPAAKVLVLTAHCEDEYLEQACAAGVAGFLEKHSSAEVLTRAILAIHAGNTYFSQSIAKRLRCPASAPHIRSSRPKLNGVRLTSREAEVLQLVAEGLANKQIATELRISIKTVEKHRQHLMDKLDIHDTAGLTRHAIAVGMIESTVQLTIV